jgi:hypothetical protein
MFGVQKLCFDCFAMAQVESSHSSLTCGRCSSLIKFEWLFCEYCGHRLQFSLPPVRRKPSFNSSISSASSSLPSQLPVLPKLKLKTHLQNIRQDYLPVRKQRSQNFNPKKKSSNSAPAPEEKLKELEEKRYQNLEQLLQKYEKHNEKMTKYYNRMEMICSQPSKYQSPHQRGASSNQLPPSDPLNPSLYLHEQPSILDRLNEGFTTEEDAERVLFWGGGKSKSTDDLDNRATQLPNHFTSSYWGPSEYSEINGDIDLPDSDQLILPSADHMTEAKEEHDQSQEEEEDARGENSIGLESIRRQITRHLLFLIHFLRWILRKTDFDVLIDPLSIPHSLQLYAKHSLRLTVAISRGYEVQQMIANEFSRRYLLTADSLRRAVAVEIAEAQHEADVAHQGCHELYQCISSGVFLNTDFQPEFNHSSLITDPVLIQRNQQRVLEYSKELLDPVRLHINQLIAKETQMIARIRSDEMALRTAQEHYQPIIMDLILNCKVIPSSPSLSTFSSHFSSLSSRRRRLLGSQVSGDGLPSE